MKPNWRPATPTNGLEFFEVPCKAEFWFHGPCGEQASVRIYDDGEDDNAIGVECDPEDRAGVIAALSALLDLMRGAT